MKQETLEEVAEIWVHNRFTKQIKDEDIYASKSSIIESHILFAKWQQEKDKEMEKQQQDEFAIGFAEFSINYNYHPMHKVWIKFDKMANEKFTTQELLEIYKKEKGL